MKRWLTPDQEVEQVIEKIAVVDWVAPGDERMWVTSQNPGKPGRVAELMESYDTAHSRVPDRTRPRQEHKHSSQSRDYHKKHEGGNTGKKKPFSERTCFKCNRKGHIARDCTEKNLQANEKTNEKTKEAIWCGEGRVNGQFLRKILH